jgi:tRNA(fMet)-specific endonuclease VapC
LRQLKLNVRKMDLRIAAVVLEQNATLVTRNARDFKQVPGLTFVDWSQ